MSLPFNRLDKIKVLISPETRRANFCFSRRSKERRSALSGILTFSFLFFHGRRGLLFPSPPPSVLPELHIYWINYANAQISTGIRPECFGSPGSWTPPGGRRCRRSPSSPPPRHRRPIVSGAQMRFARVLAWITHASSGNPDPSRLPPPGTPGTFGRLPPRQRLRPTEFLFLAQVLRVM